MKAIDILAESKIDEAPVGALGQIGRKLGSAALGAAGLKTWAADLGGKAEMGDRANQYYTAFRRYLAQTGKDEKTADYTDLAGFLKKSNLDAKYFAGKKGIIDPAVVNQGFTKMAQDYFKGTAASAKTVGSKSAAGNIAGSSGVGTAATPAAVSATGQSVTQPFSIPALIQVIPQMNKRDLNKINTAVQAALQGKAVMPKQPVNTQGMTPAQTKAVKKAATAVPVNTAGGGRIEPTLGNISKSAPKKAVAV